MSSSPLVLAIPRIFLALVDDVKHTFRVSYIFGWDIVLAFLNLITRDRPVGSVVPVNALGAHGVWPPFVAPRPTDSRSPCPALNAMANHVILPHDGRNISLKGLTKTVQETYNFSPSFSYFVPYYVSQMLDRDYETGCIDLDDLSVHNGIEHDASLTRFDIKHQPDQGSPAPELIFQLLSSASGPTITPSQPTGEIASMVVPLDKLLTARDLSAVLARRRVHSRENNGQYTQSTFHKLFGSSNSSTLLTIFGGRVDDLLVLLTQERIPDKWEPRIRHRYGLTIAEFNKTVLAVEFGIDEKKAAAEEKKKTN